MKQIAIYMHNEEFEKAYGLSKDFLAKFPKEMMSHFFLAKSAFWLGKYEECKAESQKAFNIATDTNAMKMCAILGSSAHYQLGEYGNGYKMLETVSKTMNDGSVQQMLFILAVAMKDRKKAIWHLDQIFALNKEMTKELIAEFI